MSEERGEHEAWRPGWLLLILAGALAGLVAYAFGRGEAAGGFSLTDDALSLALAAAVVAAALAFAFTLERQRWTWSLGFAIIAAVVTAGVFYWNGPPDPRDADLLWRYLALALAFAAAIPLFQAMRDEGRWRFPYVTVHWYAWTDLTAALATAALILSGMLVLSLVGVELASPAHWDQPLGWVVTGAALALAIGLLRSIAGATDLQAKLRLLLGFLAPLMVIALLALPFIAARGGSLAGASLALGLGAILFINAVLGNGPDQQSPNPLLRFSAMVLGALLLPLALIAGLAVWMRISDYGYSPNRLWAGVFALALAAIAIRYLASLLRRRKLWAEPVRRNNIRVLGALFLFALLLATPLVSFSSIATRDQMARLAEGRTPPQSLDWRALRFAFGRNGVRALQGLREGVETSPEVRSLAAQALLAEHPSQLPTPAAQRP